MTKKSINPMRMVLLASIVLVFAVTAVLYFRTGEFYFTGFVVGGCCAVIFIITGEKRSQGKQ